MDKNVFITGAGGALGTVVRDFFIKTGYIVYATRSPRAKLPDNISGYHEEAIDLTHEDQVNQLVDKWFKEKPVHAAILMAGGFQPGKLNSTSGSDLEKMMAVNFYTAFFAAKALVPIMKSQQTGGRIILIGSRPSLSAFEGKKAVGYALSKSLIFRLSELINAEGGSSNVVSTVIVPGTIDTSANRQAMPDADFSSWVKPEEIADTLLFLCSDKASSWREPIIKMYGH